MPLIKAPSLKMTGQLGRLSNQMIFLKWNVLLIEEAILIKTGRMWDIKKKLKLAYHASYRLKLDHLKGKL